MLGVEVDGVLDFCFSISGLRTVPSHNIGMLGLRPEGAVREEFLCLQPQTRNPGQNPSGAQVVFPSGRILLECCGNRFDLFFGSLGSSCAPEAMQLALLRSLLCRQPLAQAG